MTEKKEKGNKEVNGLFQEKKIKGIRTINSSVKAIKLIALVGVSLPTLAMIILLIFYIRLQKERDQKVYVVTEGNTYEAFKSDDQNRADSEIKNHVRFFYKTMFEHDQYSYEENVNYALKLINRKDGSKILKDLEDGNILNIYKKYDSRTQILIDSIRIDKSVDPWIISCYAAQRAIYEDEIKEIPIASRCNMTRINRSNENPFGLVIYNFEFIRYKREEDKGLF